MLKSLLRDYIFIDFDIFRIVMACYVCYYESMNTCRSRGVFNMFLKQTKRAGGRVYLSIVEGFREGGTIRQRTVEPIGYLDELKDTYDDPIAHFKGRAAELTAEKDARAAPVTLTIHPAQKVDIREGGLRREVGSCVPLAVYNALGIDSALNNERKTTRSRAAFSLAQATRLMVVERLLSPGSKLSDVRNIGRHFFKSELSDDDLYHALSELAHARSRITASVSSHISRLVGRDTSRVFYDVTNYYWEIDDEDELRKRGVSKERRPEPIVQMGLLVDNNAIPIDYRLFSGNTHDGKTMDSFIEEAAPDASEVIWVADKGCNTKENMVDARARGQHFLWSQSIRGSKSKGELRDWVLDDAEYKGIAGDADAGPGFRVKSKQDTLVLEVAGPDGKKTKVPIEVRYVAFWSRKYQQRARSERKQTIERARDMVAHPAKYDSVTSKGALKYVTKHEVDPDGVLGSLPIVTFDAEALAADEALDGYYLIVTSKTDMEDLEVIDTYRGLWRIEESFRITKSDLTARPVYLSRPDHIEAHFLICFVALTIVRLMQLAVRERRGNSTAPSAAQMLGDLSQVAATRLESNWWVFDHRTDLTDELFSAFGLEVPTRYMQLTDIRQLGAKKNAWKGIPSL